MELRVLKYFLMVAREENITKAARLLHVTQPTLSRQLIQLEEELGVKLFHRSRHHIVLTDDGMLFKRRAQEITALAEKTEREFTRKEGELIGEISIGSGELQSSQVLIQALAAFREQYPLVQYEIYSGNSDNIKERIEQGTLDLGLLLEPVDISKYEFVRMPVKEEWGVLVREDSELAGRQNIQSEDLIHVPLILTRREMIQNELMNWLGIYRDQLEIVASGNLLYNLAIMTKNNLGISINLKLDCKYDGIRYIPLSPKLESNTVLVWKKTQSYSQATAAFIIYFKKYVSGIFENSI